MNYNRTRWMMPIASAAVLASLAACGGSGDTPPAEAAASAQNDAAKVSWNTSTALAVTSNDTVQHGTAKVAVTTAPAHGTAVVEGENIRYTPVAGYFGADTLRYLLTVGDKTSEASVQIAVAAHMTLSGTVRDAPLVGAKVVATVGGVPLPEVTADASGNYQVTVTTTDPTAFISLKASGVGAQSNFVLSSLVGDASEAAAVVSDTGAIDAAALPAANVTHVSTAISVLSGQALGKPAASSADVTAALGQFTPEQTIQMATAIKMVVDAGVTLPSGSADTLALVSDPGAFKSFVTTQSSQNAAVFAQTQQAVLDDRQIAVAPPVPAPGAADKTILLVLGRGAAAIPATRLTLKDGNVATVEGDSVRTAKWSSDGSQISVVYDTPTAGGQDYADDGTGQWQAISISVNGFKLRQLGGSPGVGTATVSPISSFTWLEGPQVGSTVDYPDNWAAETMVTAGQAFSAADFPIGTRWAGVMSTDFSPTTSPSMVQDTVRIVDATRLVFDRTQQSATWALVDGKFVITTDSGVFTYARLFTGPLGEERWLVDKTVDGARAWTYENAAIKVQDGASFTASSLVARWDSYISVGMYSVGKLYLDLAADGTSGTAYEGGGGIVYGGKDGNWSLGTDGLARVNEYRGCTIGSPGCEPYKVRTWQLLGTSGNRIYVMERQRIPGHNSEAYFLNVYMATGG